MVVSLQLDAVEAAYERGPARITVLRGIDLAVEAGEVVAVQGRSGSGKTTLLQIAGALATPAAGTVRIGGRRVDGLDAAARARLRRTTIGFVFQAFHLLPGLSVLDNVALPLLLDGCRRSRARIAAAALVEEVGLADRANHRPAELSGGEAQRVAVARALVSQPAVVLADEPTGNLDDGSATSVLDALVGRARARGICCVVATHDAGVAARADRTLALTDGLLEPVARNAAPTEAARSTARRMIVAMHLRRLWEQRLRTFVAIIAVAGGVALASGVLIGQASIERSLDGYAAAIGGVADLRVDGPVDQAGLADSTIPAMREVLGVELVAPLVNATTTIDEPDGGHQFVIVLGVDCAVVPLCAPDGRLAASRSVLADVEPGSLLRTNTGTLDLGQAYASDALESLFGGRFLVLPLADAQRVFDRGSWIDAAYVTVAAGASEDDVRRDLAGVIGPSAFVHTAASVRPGSDVVGQLLVGLFLVSLVGLAIGAQLVGNTLSLSFEERRRELATIAAVGAPPGVLARGIVAEAALLGGAGGILGAFLGVLVARPAIAALNDQFSRATGLLIEVRIPLFVVVVSLVLGVGVSLLAAVRPARRVARLDLAAELVERDRHDPQAAWSPWRTGLCVLGLAAGTAIAWLGSRDGSLQQWQPAAAVGGQIIGIWFAFRLPGLVAGPIVGWLSRSLDVTGPLRAALGALAGDPRRTAVITGAIASAIGLGVTLGGIEPALRRGADELAELSATDRVQVTGLPVNNAASLDAKLSDAEVAALTAIPGVAGVQGHYNATIDHPDLGLLELIGEQQPPTAFEVFRGQEPISDLLPGEAMVGAALARTEGLEVGDELVVPGREGDVPLVVRGIWAAPAQLARNISVERSTFERIAGPRRPSYLLLEPAAGTSAAELVDRVRAAHVRDRLVVADAPHLGVLLGRDFHAYTAPFKAVQRGLVLVAVVATASTLLLAGIQRRREHALLSAVGMTASGLALTTIAEVGVLGAIAAVLGPLAGAVGAVCFGMASGVLTGWRIGTVWSVGPVVAAALVAMAGALLGAMLPAWRTSRIDPATALRYE